MQDRRDIAAVVDLGRHTDAAGVAKLAAVLVTFEHTSPHMRGAPRLPCGQGGGGWCARWCLQAQESQIGWPCSSVPVATRSHMRVWRTAHIGRPVTFTTP